MAFATRRARARWASSSSSRLPPPPPYERRRVVVTGIGMVTPLGADAPTTWRALLAGASGVVRLPPGYGGPGAAAGDAAAASAGAGAGAGDRIAALVPRAPAVAGGFDAAGVVDRGAARVASAPFIAYALAASREALADAGLLPAALARAPVGSADGPARARRAGAGSGGAFGPHAPARAGVFIGSGVGGLDEIAAAAAASASAGGGGGGGARGVGPFFVPRVLANSASGGVSLAFGAEGPTGAPSTACASGASAIADAARAIALGHADVALAGGSEACVGPLALAGFARAKALAPAPPAGGAPPSAASRPFDAGRAGFVLGEGAGVLVLEEAGAAAARGARVYAELRGAGASGDAHHVTAPPDDGAGALRAMRAALADGGVPAGAVGYINAHATGTPAGDAVEARALGALLAGARATPASAAVSSTKGALGHLLGAAGAVEAAITVLALSTGNLPGTLNLDAPDAAVPAHLAAFPPAAAGPLARRVDAALSNSFGFGGVNVALLFTRY